MSKPVEFKKIVLTIGLSCLLLLLWQTPSADASDAIGKFTLVEGKVDVLRGGVLPAAPVKAGDPVFLKDIIRTKSDSKAEIVFVDNNVLKIGQRSRIDISEYVADEGKRSAVIRLPRGKVQATVPEETVKRISITPETSRFEIQTPNAVAGVRGTDFLVLYDRNITEIFVNEGIVCGYNTFMRERLVCIQAGLFSTIQLNAPPTSPRPITRRDSLRHEKEAKARFIPIDLGEVPPLTGAEGSIGPLFGNPVQIPFTIPVTDVFPPQLPPPPHE